jgi:hypothetical protein
VSHFRSIENTARAERLIPGWKYQGLSLLHSFNAARVPAAQIQALWQIVLDERLP